MLETVKGDLEMPTTLGFFPSLPPTGIQILGLTCNTFSVSAPPEKLSSSCPAMVMLKRQGNNSYERVVVVVVVVGEDNRKIV